MRKILITIIFSTITFFAYSQTAKQVVENFINSIGKQDFKSAYALQNIPAWGNLEKFSSVKAFGGIYKTEIITIEQKPDDKGNSVVFADAVYYDSINGNKEFEENFYLSNSTGQLKIIKVKVLKTKNPMLKKIRDEDFKDYIASYKETNFPVDLAKSIRSEGAPEIPEQYIKKYIDKDYIANTGDVSGVAKYCYSSALFTDQYIAVLYIFACEMCNGINNEYQTLHLNTFTYAGVPISKFEVGSNSSAVGMSNNGGTIRNSYKMSGKINSNSMTKVLHTHYEEEIPKETSKGNIFQIQLDGHIYKTTKIGAQTWMAENLAFKASSGCWAYNNEESNVGKYGRLYNWETAKTACPAGWRLPSKTDFETLLKNVGSNSTAYATLISIGSSGFSAPFGGSRSSDGIFGSIGEDAAFWTSSASEGTDAWAGLIISNLKVARMGYGDKSCGFSVRCISN